MLLAILAGALCLRLVGLRFGLPSLYDPDEPFFVITSLKLLRDHTLNPGWFGHPGTTTIYMLALIELAVISIGLLTGRFGDIQAFGAALYSDPSLIVVPARLFIVACGVACVLLTFLLGRRLSDDRTGLVAAGLLAINPLHIAFSQIIRTDVQASVFLLLCSLACVGICERGRLRDYLFAALWLGLACATKWPAATIGIAIPGACLIRCRSHPDEIARQIRYLAAAAAAAVGALFLASPYIFIDYRTVLADVGGEAQTDHLGATGGGLLHNIAWYVAHPLRNTIGSLGLVLALIGLAALAWRSRAARATILPGAAAFLLAICAQRLIWSRWIVPLLPFVSIFMAVGLWVLVERARRLGGARIATGLAAAVLIAVAVPMAVTTVRAGRERLHDTRAIASAWMRAHIGPGRTVLVEYLALDLLPQPWRFLFPAGRLGCIDGRGALTGQVRTKNVAGWRRTSSIVDIGTIDPAMLAVCRADYALFTDYDRYRAERTRFPEETANYEALARNGAVLTIRPVPGVIGGPTVRIVRLPPVATTTRHVTNGLQ